MKNFKNLSNNDTDLSVIGSIAYLEILFSRLMLFLKYKINKDIIIKIAIITDWTATKLEVVPLVTLIFTVLVVVLPASSVATLMEPLINSFP